MTATIPAATLPVGPIVRRIDVLDALELDAAIIDWAQCTLPGYTVLDSPRPIVRAIRVLHDAGLLDEEGHWLDVLRDDVEDAIDAANQSAAMPRGYAAVLDADGFGIYRVGRILELEEVWR